MTLQHHSVGFGKIILLGEHAAVFGRHIVAAPIPLAIETQVTQALHGICIKIPAWGVDIDCQRYVSGEFGGLITTLKLLISAFGLTDQALTIEVDAHIPHSSGLGASAALSVSLIRALSEYAQQPIANQGVNELALQCEQIAHQNPSGIDNMVATTGEFLLYRKGPQTLVETIASQQPLELVIGLSGQSSATAKMVAQTQRLWESAKTKYNAVFDQIDALTLAAVAAIKTGNLNGLGACMNDCQQLLSRLNTSSPVLDKMIGLCRQAGALGAKLTGSGGGGAMIALCPGKQAKIASLLKRTGFNAMEVTIG